MEVKRTATKVFFIPALERGRHRDIVHQRVQELIAEDSGVDASVHPGLIHLGQCGWEAVGQVLSPTYFAMTLVRKYDLLPSERCILLPLSDQYQAIQLCLAKINKKKHGDFMAAVSDVLDVWNELYRDCITPCNELSKSLTSAPSNDGDDDLLLPSSRRQSYDPVVRETQEIVADYREFLRSAGCIDHFTVYALLREHLKSNQEIVEHIHSKAYIIEDLSRMPTMERELIKLLLSDAQIFKLSVALPLLDSSSSSSILDMSGIGEDVLNTSQVKDAPKDHQDNEMDHSLKEEEAASALIPSVEKEDLNSSLTKYIEEIPRSPGTTDFCESELYVEQLIVVHLRLLINTRDELALAALCSMPGREITQEGFHGIKAEAQKKNMQMYQTILSFIMRLRLGGKGYQSDVNSHMLLHSKPLGEFVNSIMKLQDIVDEEPNPKNAAVKVLSAIKSGLMRIRGRALRGSCIEKVWDCLNSAFTRITSVPEDGDVSKESNVTTKLQQTTAALKPCLKLLVQLCDEASGRIAEEIVDVLGENFLTQCNSSKKSATPIRIPTLLSLFRSPIDGNLTSSLNMMDDIDDAEDSLRVRLMKSKGLTPNKAAAPRFKSGCSWAPDDLSPVNKGEDVHDKTLSPIVGPTLKAVGNTRKSHNWRDTIDSVAKEEEQMRKESESPSKKSKNVKKIEEKKSKRSLLSDISNIAKVPVNKKTKFSDTTKKSPAKKKIKTKPILKGQKSITSFFKV